MLRFTEMIFNFVFFDGVGSNVRYEFGQTRNTHDEIVRP